MESQAERELRLLASGRERILEAVMKAEQAGNVNRLPYQNYLIRQVIEELVESIKHDLKPKKGAKAFLKFSQYLGTIDLKIAALRAIQAVLRVVMEAGGGDIPQPVWKKTAHAIGSAIYGEYLMTRFKDMSPALFNSLMREYNRSMTSDERHVLAAFKAKYKNEGYDVPLWEFGDLEKIGEYILHKLVAFRFLESWSRTEKHKNRILTVRYLQLDEQLRGASLDLIDRMAAAPRVASAMVEEPLPWDYKTNQGGGFHTPDMQRLSAYAVQGKGPGPVSELIVETTNALQRTQWEVNRPVLQAVRIVSQRQDFGDVVSPDPGPRPEFSETFTEAEKAEWKGTMRKWYTEKKVRTAKHLKNQRVFREAAELAEYPTIWFSFYADFRGRQYARAANLSPQGGDLEKGLLRFKRGKPVPAKADWFLSAGANRYGLDKVPLADQIAWVKENHDFIVRIGTEPDIHTEWVEADSPVQFLAWAIEYAQWSAEPEGFLSHLPLGQDGTCNGLQNYSALMCDAVGGAAVNLVPGPAPRDVYGDVAGRVVSILERDEPGVLRDGWLAHGITRKQTKRPVMTLPYGSTRFAASEFIMDYIEDEGTPELTQIPPELWGDAANYLSYRVWDGMGEVVSKAMEVMAWLQGWAKHAIENGKKVAWVSPAGLHVTSEYEGVRKSRVKSVGFKSQILLYKPTGKPDLKKTMNAVAPNFVHSLDASHLARVVRRASAEGMDIAAIHDDFGTHAADTERFRDIIREEFVAMYEGNTILEDMAKATGYTVPPPAKGDLDLRSILASVYFFF